MKLKNRRILGSPEVDNIGGVGSCNKIINVLVSMFLGLIVFTCAVMALKDIEGTGNDDEWRAIASSGLAVVVVQMATNIPYIFVRTVRKAKWAYYVWAGYHLFASMACITLFFLDFYLIDHLDYGSAKLRQNFWAQFKLRWELSKAFLEAMLVFHDFVGLNAAASLFMVVYPRASRIWNRNSSDDVRIALG